MAPKPAAAQNSPVKHNAPKRSRKQVAAGKKFAAGGRAAQKKRRAAFMAAHHGKKPPRSPKQRAAASKFAAAGRAAQAARRAGKQPVKPKARALAQPASISQAPGDMKRNIHELPVCAAVAVAEHLALCTGLRWSDAEILELAELARDDAWGVRIDSVLQVAAPGFRGAPALRFSPAAPGPFTVAGMALEAGPHAALVIPGNLVTWGSVIREADIPHITEETWAIEWLL